MQMEIQLQKDETAWISKIQTIRVVQQGVW